MKFEQGNMYKNIYRDKDMAILVDEVLSDDKNGTSLMVTWYKQDDKGRYLTVGIEGEFYITKDQKWHYVLV